MILFPLVILICNVNCKYSKFIGIFQYTVHVYMPVDLAQAKSLLPSQQSRVGYPEVLTDVNPESWEIWVATDLEW